MKLYSKFKTFIRRGEITHRITWPVLRAYRHAIMRSAQLFRGIDDNKVVFSSLHGRSYNDNPRYISEKLHEMRPQTDIVWLYRDGCRDVVNAPEYVRKVPTLTPEGLREQATAKVWVDNFRKSDTIYISPKQIYINTWHGDRGFKCVGEDAVLEGGKNFHHTFIEEYCSLRVAGSDFGEKVYRTSHRYKGEVMKQGCPRNDLLLRGDVELAERTKAALGISNDVKVLIYAPTFRDNGMQTELKAPIDLPRALDCFERSTGQKWICLCRAHYLTTGLSLTEDVRLIDVSKWPEMTELLLISDALITDYSSCAADFMLTEKPAFLYVDDMTEYNNSCRKFYFDLEQSPYLLARNMEELEALIETTDAEKARENSRAIGEFYGVHETGHACESVCEYIIDKLK